MDPQTLEIVQSLRGKAQRLGSSVERSALSEFYEPSKERAHLKRTALAHNPAARTPAKPAEKPKAPETKPAAKTTPSNADISLARVMAANKAAEAQKNAKPQHTPQKQALLARIKKMINQSVDQVDIPALIEDMELYVSITEATDPSHQEVTEMLHDLSKSLLEGYEVEEPLKGKLQSWVRG